MVTQIFFHEQIIQIFQFFLITCEYSTKSFLWFIFVWFIKVSCLWNFLVWLSNSSSSRRFIYNKVRKRRKLSFTKWFVYAVTKKATFLKLNFFWTWLNLKFNVVLSLTDNFAHIASLSSIDSLTVFKMVDRV